MKRYEVAYNGSGPVQVRLLLATWLHRSDILISFRRYETLTPSPYLFGFQYFALFL